VSARDLWEQADRLADRAAVWGWVAILVGLVLLGPAVPAPLLLILIGQAFWMEGTS
jgi:hypothetical protein